MEGANVAALVPEAALSNEDFTDGAILIAKALVVAGLCKSNSDGRRLIQGGAVAINDQKVTDVNALLTLKEVKANELTIRAGKKNFRRLVLK